jgi:hypothetical protein
MVSIFKILPLPPPSKSLLFRLIFVYAVISVVEIPNSTSETETFVLEAAELIANFRIPLPYISDAVLSKNNAPLIRMSVSVSSVLNNTPAILGSSSASINTYALFADDDLKCPKYSGEPALKSPTPNFAAELLITAVYVAASYVNVDSASKTPAVALPVITRLLALLLIVAVPEEPEVPDDPLDPELPDEPLDPLVPEEPLDPEVPDEPEDPLVPEVPLEPDVPDEPLEPDVPDEPLVPDEPEDPLVPEVPLEPDVPDEPLEPDVPDEPLVPDEPEDPLVPEVPLEPDVPDEPLEPDVPDEPLVPDEPEDPLVPLDPDVPEDPLDPDVPDEPEQIPL